MRILIAGAVLVTLFSLAAPGLAQQHQAPPPWFTAEEIQQLQELQPKISEAFNFKDYEGGIGLLAQVREIYQKALARVEGDEVTLPENASKEAVVKSLTDAVAGTWYNSACCLSMTGKKAEAIEALGHAIDLGWMDVDHMKLDGDLDPIRQEPGYKKLLDSLNYNEVYETYVPEGVTGPAPLVVLLHPSRYNEKDWLDIFKPVADAKKVIVVAPRGPVMLAKDSFDWGRTSDDEESAMKKIAFTIEKVKAAQPVDPARIWLVGYGNGGKYACTYGLSHPDKVSGVLAVQAYWNKYYYEDFLPAAKEQGLKICLVEAKQEPGYDRCEAGVTQITNAGVAGKFIAMDWEGIEVDRSDEKDVFEEKRMARRKKYLAAMSEGLDWFAE